MNRRHLAWGAGLGLCLAAGLGWGFRQRWQQQLAQQQKAASPINARQYLDALTLKKTDGTTATLAFGKTFLLNFWATWCPPCLHELPLLDRFAANSEHVVIGLAVDDLMAVQMFLAQRNLGLDIVVANVNDGITLAGELGNETFALPYSVSINGAGEVQAMKLGAFATEMEIEEFLQAAASTA